jgi:hypothetical protein
MISVGGFGRHYMGRPSVAVSTPLSDVAACGVSDRPPLSWRSAHLRAADEGFRRSEGPCPQENRRKPWGA